MRRRLRAARAGAVALALAAFAFSVAEARPARAESPADVEAARAFFLEATKLGNEGRWKEARELYARSLALKPSAMTRYSLGVAQKETGRFADALGSFRAFLAEPPTAATAPFVEPARSAIAELEGRVGRVTIAMTPHPVEGLSLAIDGQPAPTATELIREIDAGPHEIVARAPGFRATITRFNAVAGAPTTVPIALARMTRTAAGLATADFPAGSPLASPRTAPLDSSAPYGKALPVVLMGSGGALFVAGLALGLVGVKQASDAPTRDGPEASAARAKGLAGDVLAGAGIAAVGAGLVLLLVRGRHVSTTGGSSPTMGLMGLSMGPSMSASRSGVSLCF